MGARALLLDEDTCATNFMIRDARMQARPPQCKTLRSHGSPWQTLPPYFHCLQCCVLGLKQPLSTCIKSVSSRLHWTAVGTCKTHPA